MCTTQLILLLYHESHLTMSAAAVTAVSGVTASANRWDTRTTGLVALPSDAWRQTPSTTPSRLNHAGRVKKNDLQTRPVS